MNKNTALSISLKLLCSPFSLLAMGLLCLNDHLLRVYWPSWWTGKLGDFAWLFFTPFALGVLLSLGTPARLHRWVGTMACGLVGGVFVLGKTLPAFHAGLVKLMETALGGGVSLVRDPTDLIALVSLAAGWWLWQREARQPAQRAPAPAWALLPIAAFLTLANAAYQDSGISCLEAVEGKIYAWSGISGYVSRDGGLSWLEAPVIDDLECAPGEFASVDEPGIVYVGGPQLFRYIPGETIERSDDGGLIWKFEYQVLPLHQAERAFYERTRGHSSAFAPPPVAAVYDPESQHIVFAMQQEGVLVRQSDGTYLQVGVGPYRKLELKLQNLFLSMLAGESVLGACVGAWMVGWMALRLRRSLLMNVLKNLSMIGLILVVVILPPALQGGMQISLSVMSVGMVALLTLPLVVYGVVVVLQKNREFFLYLVIVFFIAWALALAPFVAWAYMWLPDYWVAAAIAAALQAGLYLSVHRATQTWGEPIRYKLKY